MSQTPSAVNPPETLSGYDPPQVWQFSVFLDNRLGKMLQLLECFDDPSTLIVGLSVLDAADHAVIRLIMSNAVQGRKILKANDLPFSEIEVLAVEVERGETARLCVPLLRAEVSIHYVYPLLVQPYGQPVLALHTDNQFTAGDVLRRHHLRLLAEHELTQSPMM